MGRAIQYHSFASLHHVLSCNAHIHSRMTYRADRSRRQLQDMKRGYVGRSDAIKQQVNMVSAQYEQKKRNLAENDTARYEVDVVNRQR